MALLSANNPITANGTYDIPVVPGYDYIIGAFGLDWGGGSLGIASRDDESGAKASFPDSPLTATGTFSASPATNKIRFTMTGATTPSVHIRVTRKISS